MPAAHPPPRSALTAGVLALGFALAGCSGPAPSLTAPQATTGTSADGAAGPTTQDGPGHGYVEGAEEMTEPQLRLAVTAPDGTTTGIDLLTGDPVDLPDVPAPTAVTTDGRYLFAGSGSGLTVVDSGAWTVPHGDHSHYYLAGARTVGEVTGTAMPRISSTPSLLTVLDGEAGRAAVLDGAALGRGTITPLAEIDDVPPDGLLVPLGDRLVQTVASAPGGPADTVRILDATGDPLLDAEIACPAAAGTITSRVGVVVGCADGAVLAVPGTDATPSSDDTGTGTDTDSGDAATAPAVGVTLEHIPYPTDVPAQDRATDFRAREDRPVVAALAGRSGAWVLDTRDRTWSHLPTPTPLVAVSAVDDSDHAVVAVDRDGRILVLDAETGATTGTTEPLLAATLADPALAGAVTLEVDAARAYVNDPAGRRILEIDHGDGGRVSREFPVADVPMFLAQVGR